MYLLGSLAQQKYLLSQTSTTTISDAATNDEIQVWIARSKKELAETDSVYDSEKLAERIAKGRVAVTKVGAATEAELEGPKLRMEHAKNATFAAIEAEVLLMFTSQLLFLLSRKSWKIMLSFWVLTSYRRWAIQSNRFKYGLYKFICECCLSLKLQVYVIPLCSHVGVKPYIVV